VIQKVKTIRDYYFEKEIELNMEFFFCFLEILNKMEKLTKI